MPVVPGCWNVSVDNPRNRGFEPSLTRLERAITVRQLKVFRPEHFAKAHLASGHHELAIAPVMDSARDLGRGGHMRLHDLHDEEAVLGQEARIDDLTFEIGLALLDERGIDPGALHRGKLEFVKLGDLRA